MTPKSLTYTTGWGWYHSLRWRMREEKLKRGGGGNPAFSFKCDSFEIFTR